MRIKGLRIKGLVRYGILSAGLLLSACGGENNPTSTSSPNAQTGIESPSATGSTAPAVAPPGLAATPTPYIATPVPNNSSAAAASPAATLVTGGQSAPASVVPAYSNLKQADPGAQLEQRLDASLMGGPTSSANVGYFTTSSSFDEVVAYYDKTLTASGYKKQGRSNLSVLGNFRIPGGAIVAYSKNGATPSSIGIVNAGVINDDFYSQLTTAELTSTNLPRGNRLIIILNNVPAGLG